MEEGSGAGAGDEAEPKVGVQESLAHKVGAFKGGERARGSGIGDRREKSGIFEGKEEIGKVREIELASAVFGPRLAGERGVKGDDELAGGVDGAGGNVEGHHGEQRGKG